MNGAAAADQGSVVITRGAFQCVTVLWIDPKVTQRSLLGFEIDRHCQRSIPKMPLK